jgi:immunity protein, SdpI family
MKTSWKTELPLLLLIVAMFAVAVLSWSSAPDRIPVHWGPTGEVDRYGGKVEGLLMPPAVAVLVYLMMLFLPRIDPGRANYRRFSGAYYTIRAAVLATIAVVYGTINVAMRGQAVDVPRLIGLVVGGLFFLLGNLLGKIRPNWFVGVRTPWTLSSKRAWTRTHRLAGWVFILGGLAIMAAGLFRTALTVGVAVGVMVGGLIAATVYSYLVWRTDPDRVPPAGTLPSNGET